MGQEGVATSGKIRVRIAHDVCVFREGLAMLLGRWPEFCIVNMTSTGEIDHLGDDGCDIDLVLIGASGGCAGISEKIQQVKKLSSNTKVVVIGVSDSPGEILTCIESGASAYTLQESSPEQLVETLRMVNVGETLCPPNISALLFQRIADLKNQVHPMGDDRLSRLTRRELEILRLVSSGMSNKEIAVHVNLELQTVKNYVHSILEKMRVSNRREAATYVGALPDLSLVLT